MADTKKKVLKGEGNGHTPVEEEETQETEAPMTNEEYIQSLSSYQDAVSRLQQELDEMRQQNSGSAAKLKLVNMSFDTPDSKLSELTIIPRNLVFRLTYQIELEAYFDPNRDPIRTPLSTVRRLAFFKLMRSVGGQHLMRASMLAENELRTPEGEMGEEEKW